MCGVIGYAASRPLTSPELLAEGRDALSARGPDGAGLWCAQSLGDSGGARWHVGLGHRRLAIRDLSDAGHQPMLSNCGRYALCYNGELYEEQRLRDRLSGRAIEWRGHSDTELLLNLLIYEGVEVLSSRNGIFAFAFWDSHTGQLTLARDRFGVKPLFWSEREGGLCFASEVKGLLKAGLVPFELDPHAHLALLTLTYSPGPRSALRGVSQLPPGSWVRWTAPRGLAREEGALERGRYWRPAIHADSPLSFKEASRALERRLIQAVSERLISDVPVGVLLSGGLDSSGLVYAASAAGVPQLDTFTVRFSEQSFDESHYASLVAQRFGARHHVELVRPEPEEVFGPLMEALDTPFADSSAIPLWYLCQSAREHVTVVLGGDGGDELFAGYSTHLAGQIARLYRLAPRPLRALIERGVGALPVRHSKVSLDLKLKQFIHAASAPPAEAHFRFKEFLSPELRSQLLQPLLKRFQGLDERSTLDVFTPYFEPDVKRAGERSDLLSQTLSCDQSVYLPDNILVKGDRVSMGCSLELRVPYLDPHLSALANALPSNFKRSARGGKLILQAALTGHLPPEILRRPKRGFNVPMAQWLLGPLAPLVSELLSPDVVSRYAMWDSAVVQRMIQEHREMRKDHSRPLWAMLCFIAYLRRHQPHGYEPLSDLT